MQFPLRCDAVSDECMRCLSPVQLLMSAKMVPLSVTSLPPVQTHIKATSVNVKMVIMVMDLHALVSNSTSSQKGLTLFLLDNYSDSR